ncbi:MAG: hypothetical protein Q7J27_04130 [Syntrophales bacterium]|nr:hypothetical protein [Syntrophales bacterium]
MSSELIISLAISLTALIISIGSFGWSIHIGRRRMNAAELASLSHVVNIEQTLGQIPTALKFHGITPEEMEEADIEPKEVAYLLSSFTAGGIYHGTKAQKKIKTFEVGSYRYDMCKSEATRKAWPIIKRMMNPSNYRDKINATINLIHNKKD